MSSTLTALFLSLAAPPHAASDPAAAPAEAAAEEVAQLPGSLITTYFRYTDYPPEALRREHEGNVWFEVTVGGDGRVSRCEILETSGSSLLDRQTCDIARARFRFDPATDEEGRPVETRMRGRVGWHFD